MYCILYLNENKTVRINRNVNLQMISNYRINSEQAEKILINIQFLWRKNSWAIMIIVRWHSDIQEFFGSQIKERGKHFFQRTFTETYKQESKRKE